MKTDTRLAVQQGAALLLAMMTVVLVATLASAMLWQQWRTTSVETAERQSQQAHWLLVGAHDWSRVVTVWQERRPWWSRRSCLSAESPPC